MLEDSTIEKARQGDQEAFGTVYIETAPIITRYVKRLIGTEPEIVKDVVENTYLAALQKIGKTDREKPLKVTSWLLRIAHNQVQDIFRSRKANPTYSLEKRQQDRYTYEPETFLASGAHIVADDPENIHSREEWLAILKVVQDEVMTMLSHEQGQALRLVSEGLTYSEIGAIMNGRTDKQVKGILERARKMARSYFLTLAAEYHLDLEGQI